MSSSESRKVDWGATIILNLFRTLSAGVTYFILSLFFDKPNFALFGFPIAYLFAILPAALITSSLSKRGVAFTGLFAWFLCLLVAVGDPLLFIVFKIKPELSPVKQFKFFNFFAYIAVEKGDEEIASDESKSMTLPPSVDDAYTKGLYLGIADEDLGNRISYFERALSTGLSKEKELIARTFLMEGYAQLDLFDKANNEANLVNISYPSVSDGINYIENPEESIVVLECHLVPCYPSRIRNDIPEEERKKAALDCMKDFHDVMGPCVLRAYLGRCYNDLGLKQAALEEYRAAAVDYSEKQGFFRAVIFFSLFGKLLKESGDNVAANDCFKMATECYPASLDEDKKLDIIYDMNKPQEKAYFEGRLHWYNYARNNT